MEILFCSDAFPASRETLKSFLTQDEIIFDQDRWQAAAQILERKPALIDNDVQRSLANPLMDQSDDPAILGRQVASLVKTAHNVSGETSLPDRVRCRTTDRDRFKPRFHHQTSLITTGVSPTPDFALGIPWASEKTLNTSLSKATELLSVIIP